MHRSLTIAIAVALAGGAVVAAVAADGHPPKSGVQLIARGVHVNVVGAGYALEPGARLFADGSVLLGRGRRRIGVAAFTCTVTEVVRRVGGACTVTLPLPLGRISGRWPLARSRVPRERAITGG